MTSAVPVHMPNTQGLSRNFAPHVATTVISTVSGGIYVISSHRQDVEIRGLQDLLGDICWSGGERDNFVAQHPAFGKCAEKFWGFLGALLGIEGMQDIHPIGGGSGGGSGRFFGGGDRRLRHPNHQALSCPRCDSPNTKFCYYNNYNLSQPRHFCKSCRRYWTKGGVLRNVPVGGGCRKTKRSKQKSSAASTGDATRELSSNAHSSSSESSSLTAATTASTSTSTTTAVAEEGSVPSNTLSKCTVVFNCADGRFFNANPSFDHHSIVDQQADGPFFPPESFASLMTSSADVMGFGMADIPRTSYGRAQQENQAPVSLNPGEGMVRTTPEEDFKMQEMTGGINDDGLAAALEWGTGGGGGGGGDQGLFDLTAAVDPAYWSQPQWTANDHQSDYLP